jgi:hypothetical protein
MCYVVKNRLAAAQEKSAPLPPELKYDAYDLNLLDYDLRRIMKTAESFGASVTFVNIPSDVLLSQAAADPQIAERYQELERHIAGVVDDPVVDRAHLLARLADPARRAPGDLPDPIVRAELLGDQTPVPTTDVLPALDHQGAVVPPQQVAALFDPQSYLGSAGSFVDAALAAHAHSKHAHSKDGPAA